MVDINSACLTAHLLHACELGIRLLQRQPHSSFMASSCIRNGCTVRIGWRSPAHKADQMLKIVVGSFYCCHGADVIVLQAGTCAACCTVADCAAASFVG